MNTFNKFITHDLDCKPLLINHPFDPSPDHEWPCPFLVNHHDLDPSLLIIHALDPCPDLAWPLTSYLFAELLLTQLVGHSWPWPLPDLAWPLTRTCLLSCSSHSLFDHSWPWPLPLYDLWPVPVCWAAPHTACLIIHDLDPCPVWPLTRTCLLSCSSHSLFDHSWPWTLPLYDLWPVPVCWAAPHTACRACRTSWRAPRSAGSRSWPVWRGWWWRDPAPSWPPYGSWSSDSPAVPDVQRNRGSVCRGKERQMIRKTM